MSDDLDFSKKIDQVFEEANLHLQKLRTQKLHEYEEIQQRHQQAAKLANDFATSIIKPRMEELARRFEHADFVEVDDKEGSVWTCRFKHTPRYPASTKLILSVTHDEEIHNILLDYRLEILPVFMKYDSADQLALPISDFDEQRATEWVESKLITFLKTYLKMEFVDQYQKENLVTDPVLNVRISKLTAQSHVDYQGHTYYFLTDESQQTFLKEPQKYVSE